MDSSVPPKKVRWADVPDDAPMPVWPPPEPPHVIVSKHGIKMRSRDQSGEATPLKQKPPVKSK
jgi:hypothetical protein